MSGLPKLYAMCDMKNFWDHWNFSGPQRLKKKKIQKTRKKINLKIFLKKGKSVSSQLVNHSMN